MIKDKRNSLESFIKEQLIGPGGCGNNFGVYVSNENEKELVCEVLNTCLLYTSPSPRDRG